MSDSYFSDAAFSGLPLSRCLLLFISLSSNPPSFFIHPLHSIAFHPATRPKKNVIFVYLFFLVPVVSAFILKNLDGVALCLLCLLVRTFAIHRN